MTPHDVIRCPHDRTEPEFRSVENHRGHFCRKCQGSWLTPADQQKTGDRLHYDHKETLARLRKTPGLQGQLHCPLDNARLHEAGWGLLRIDWCPMFTGIWFDRTELRDFMNGVSTRQPNQKGRSKLRKNQTALTCLGGLQDVIGDLFDQ